MPTRPTSKNKTSPVRKPEVHAKAKPSVARVDESTLLAMAFRARGTKRHALNPAKAA